MKILGGAIDRSCKIFIKHQTFLKQDILYVYLCLDLKYVTPLYRALNGIRLIDNQRAFVQYHMYTVY
jgi:hypothetical protein